MTYSVVSDGVRFRLTPFHDRDPVVICGIYTWDSTFVTPEGIRVGSSRSALLRYGPPRPALFGPVRKTGGSRSEVYRLPSGWSAHVPASEDGPGETVTELFDEDGAGS